MGVLLLARSLCSDRARRGGADTFAAFSGDDAVPYDVSAEGLGKGGELPTMWCDFIDQIRDVDDETSSRRARAQAQEHGVPIGPSAGATLAVSLDIVAAHPEGTAR